MKCVLIGAGSRGMLYARWAKEHGVDTVAVAELRPDRLQYAGGQRRALLRLRFAGHLPL